MEPLFGKISIIGVGLLGGSVGMAALKRGLCNQVTGIGRTQTSLQEAIRQNAISDGTTDLAEGLAGADLVILSTPVNHIAQILPEVVAATPAGAIITDVGSTKATIVARGDEVTRGTGRYFVGCHPMAGSEKSGVSNGRANLFESTTCFVTRSPETDAAALGRVSMLWRLLGARLVISRPERHDRLTAMISHLPHLAAVALVRTVEKFNEDRNLIRGIIGNGFRDTTRVAGGSPEMWQDICTDNRTQIHQARAALEQSLNELMTACDAAPDCQKLREFLSEAREFRDFLVTRAE
jgi:prephenate dehydrogenase